MRVFFCKYNDPPYVKLEKLEIMIRIANEKNVDQLLSELKEYALEVDMDFVRRAVRAIGQCAIKIDSAASKCVNVLLDLINTKVNYVVQEAVVVIKVGFALDGILGCAFPQLIGDRTYSGNTQDTRVLFPNCVRAWMSLTSQMPEGHSFGSSVNTPRKSPTQMNYCKPSWRVSRMSILRYDYGIQGVEF